MKHKVRSAPFNYFWEVHLTSPLVERVSRLYEFVKNVYHSHIFKITSKLPTRVDLERLEELYVPFNEAKHFIFGHSSMDCVTIVASELLFGEECSTIAYKASRADVNLPLNPMDEDDIREYALVNPENVFGIEELLHPQVENLEIVHPKLDKKLLIPTLSLDEVRYSFYDGSKQN